MKHIAPKKNINAIDFFCLGFGAIVGVGWAVSINSWMTDCGGPVPAGIGYVLVLVMMIPIALCYCELVPMLPVAGGCMAFSFKAFNSVVSFLAGWASYCAFVSIIPWEAIQITTLLSYLFPQIRAAQPLYHCFGSEIYLSTILIGLLCSVVLFLINMRGLSSAVLIQRVLCLVLVSTALIGAVAALWGGNIKNLLPYYDVSNPQLYGEGLKIVTHRAFMGGCFAIFAQAAFFLAGFETIPQGIEEAGGEIRKVGKTVAQSVILACIFYAVLLLCFGVAWPWQEFAKMEKPSAATLFLHLYPGRLGSVLYWLITLGAIAGLFTTWNGFFTPSANLLMSMGRARMLPAFFAKQNKNGVAVYGQIAAFILSCVGPFLGANLIDYITCFSAMAFMMTWSLAAWSLVRLRKTYPDMSRPYKIPGGIVTGLFASIASTIVFIFMFFPRSPFYVSSLTVKAFFICMIIGILFYLACWKQRDRVSADEMEKAIFHTNSIHG